MLKRDAERAKEALSNVRDRCGDFVEPLTSDQVGIILTILGDTFPYQVIRVVAGYSEEKIKHELQVLGDENLQIQIGDYIFWFSPAFDYYSVSYSRRNRVPQSAIAK